MHIIKNIYLCISLVATSCFAVPAKEVDFQLLKAVCEYDWWTFLKALEDGADVRVTDKETGDTVLMKAIRWSWCPRMHTTDRIVTALKHQRFIVQELLGKDIDIDATNDKGETAFAIAASPKWFNEPIVELLVNAGATAQYNLRHRNYHHLAGQAELAVFNRMVDEQLKKEEQQRNR